MRCGDRSLRSSSHGAACLSRAPSDASEHSRPGRPYGLIPVDLDSDPLLRDVVPPAGLQTQAPNGSGSRSTDIKPETVTKWRRRRKWFRTRLHVKADWRCQEE